MSTCSTVRTWPALRLALLVAGWLSLPLAAEATWREDTGLTKLRSTLGDQMLTGQGVFISQVEAGSGNTNTYIPDPNSPHFDAALDPFGVEPTFVNGSDGAHPFPAVSAHATNSVAQFFYGDGLNGLARGANTIVLYEANDYLRTFLKCGNSGCGTLPPDAPTFEDPNDGQQQLTFVVQNHSWAGSLGGSSSNDQRALRKIDFLVDEHELTTVVGLENGSVANPHPTLDNLLAYSYNAIAVGRANGEHAIGPTSSLYGPGRNRPMIVSSTDTSVSAATAIVSGAATLMHEALIKHEDMTGPDGTRSEPMRAILLAGAEKKEFIDFVDPGTGLVDPWGRTASQPLDNILGVGRLNVYNSYLMTQGGQFPGSSSELSPTPVDSYGWDYSEVDSNTDRFYEIVIPEGSFAEDFSVILTWNVDINPSFNSQSLANLSLELFDSNDPNFEQSNSSVDNVEHIYIGEGQSVEYLTEGTYTLKVSGNMAQDYGIAWRTSTLFGTDPNNLTPSADFDEDGDVDGDDFLAWQRSAGTLLGASHSDGDADGDGDVDNFDLAIFEADYGTSSLLANVVGVPEPGTLVLAAAALAALMLASRRNC